MKRAWPYLKTFLAGIFLSSIAFSCSDKAKQPAAYTPSAEETPTKEHKDWLDFAYDEARIYLYDTDNTARGEFEERLIIVDDKLHASVVDTLGIMLNKQQIALANDVFSGRYDDGRGDVVSFCFTPHHGIVFYKASIPVGHASICFECHNVAGFPNKAKFQQEMLGRLMTDLGLPIEVR